MEDKNRDMVKTLVSTAVDGFSLIPCEGVWKGQSEHSLIVEVVGDATLLPVLTDVAKAIKAANRQEAVLLVTIHDDHVMI
jgi:hypothetical protein